MHKHNAIVVSPLLSFVNETFSLENALSEYKVQLQFIAAFKMQR